MRGLTSTRPICDWPGCARDAVHRHDVDLAHREWCRAHLAPACAGELVPPPCPGRCRALRRTPGCGRPERPFA